ncbi:MAG: hypothetical protein DHS20C19_19640 [Acidimicrobiales bacterium]|nr:MAG: hypothetical protein DHS20C19_19640 [Acidimicrobiales bacterium]
MLAVLAVFALLVAACGDDGETTDNETDGDSGADLDSDPGDGSDGEADGDADGDPDVGLEPVMGGSITIGQFSPPGSFDPTSSGSSNGTLGGSELRALYDTVVNWDPTVGEYELRTAESFEPNDDFTVWTLVLKDGISFTDGTPYDAEAVVYNVERHMAETSRSQSRATLLGFIESMDVVDPLTVEFSLTRPWAGFIYLFSIDVGMIASPTAIQAAGEDFGFSPGDAGAGPFVLADYRPGESMTFARNDSYYGGDVYLDELVFVPTPGGQEAAYESVRGGDLDGAYFRSAVAVSEAPGDGLSVHATSKPAGNVMDINAGVVVTCQDGAPAGCEDVADGESVRTSPPGADLRVRQAIAAAIDADQVNARAYDGLAAAGTALFQPGFPLSPEVPGPTYDPELAASLVEEAKADGWDGSIRLYSVSDEIGEALGLTIGAMLTAVGMDVEVDTSFTPPTLVEAVVFNRDYDLVIWGAPLGQNPAGNFVGLDSAYSAIAAERGFRGFSSEAMSEAIDALRLASTDDEITEAYRLVAEAWNAGVPAVALNELQNALITRSDLMGVELTSNQAMLYDEAWLAG